MLKQVYMSSACSVENSCLPLPDETDCAAAGVEVEPVHPLTVRGKHME